MSAPRRRRGSRSAALLALVGAIAVLGGTFAAGFMTGRHWSRVQVITGLSKPQAEPSRETIPPPASTPASERPKKIIAGDTGSETTPRLTFYEELTAPLAPQSTPLAAEGRKSGSANAGAATASVSPASEAGSVSNGNAAVSRAASRDGNDEASVGHRDRALSPRFTVQVVAYATRAQADALCRKLGARGFDADVSPVDTPGGTLHRVRVGRFETREEAAAMLTRLAREVKLGGFVAVR